GQACWLRSNSNLKRWSQCLKSSFMHSMNLILIHRRTNVFLRFDFAPSGNIPNANIEYLLLNLF
ncbi:hypothetical protein ABTD55_20545, partial [Acinetobacter baumannii]